MYKLNLSFTKRCRYKGFTLLEMMIAIFLSSIVILGAYTLIINLANIEATITKNNSESTVICKLSELINQDYREALINTLKYSNNELEFTSYHSLFFNGALPVKIKYFIYKNYLVRQEIRKDINYNKTIYLLPNVNNIQFEFWYNNNYSIVLHNPCYLIKLKIIYKHNPFNIFITKFKS